MIQRIQTVYLMLAAVLLGLQFAVPYATSNSRNAHLVFSDGVLNPLDNIGLLGLCSLGIALTIAAIFLFKNRPLQGKIVALAVVVAILTMLLIAFVIFNLQKELTDSTAMQYGFGALLPFLAAIAAWLALRAIGRDEKLVRSSDRLR